MAWKFPDLIFGAEIEGIGRAADVPFRPSWRVADVVEQRRVRRRVRQVVRRFPAVLAVSAAMPGADDGEVA